MKPASYLVALAFTAITIIGCQAGPPVSGEPGIEIRPAPIHEVQVNIAESYPVQIFIYIKGGLADGCTTFHELTTERIDNSINIEVTTHRPMETICTQVYGFFEKNVGLGSDFTKGETYTVNVNDKNNSFVMP